MRGNDTARQIGPGKLLEVMPGDVIDMEAYYYYQSGYSDNGAVASGAFLSNLLSLMNGAAQVASESQAVSNAVNGNAAAIFAGSNGSASRPRAYLNYILFDLDFGYLDAGYLQVGSTHSVNAALNLSKSIDKTGYIYVYVSNESNNSFDVYFDDLRITHQKGRILQEDHYYPFGMSISALSSSAPLSTPNNFKYNGKEFDTSFDLGLYDYGKRMYDPILGRFTQVDPLTDLAFNHTPYHYVMNNPMVFTDPTGMAARYNWDTEQYEDDDGNQISYQDAFASHGLNPDGSENNDPDPVESEENRFDWTMDKKDKTHTLTFNTIVTRKQIELTGGENFRITTKKVTKKITVKIKVINGTPTVIFESYSVSGDVDALVGDYGGYSTGSSNDVTLDADISDNNYTAYSKAIIERTKDVLEVFPDFTPLTVPQNTSIGAYFGVAGTAAGVSVGPQGNWFKDFFSKPAAARALWWLSVWGGAEWADDQLRPVLRNSMHLNTSKTLVK